MIKRFHMGGNDDGIRCGFAYGNRFGSVHHDQVPIPARAAGMGDDDIRRAYSDHVGYRADRERYRQPNRPKARPQLQG